MKIDDKYEIVIVVATIDSNGSILDIYNDWRFIEEGSISHRFGFQIIDTSTGQSPPNYSDFYVTISDAMNDSRRLSLINAIKVLSDRGYTIIELADMFNLSEAYVEKALSEI